MEFKPNLQNIYVAKIHWNLIQVCMEILNDIFFILNEKNSS